MTFAACLVFWGLFDSINLVGCIQFVLSLLLPFFIGFAIAYLVHPIMRLFETKLIRPLLKHRKKEYPRLTRTLSVTLSMLVTIGVVAVLLVLTIPQLITSIHALIDRMPNYINTANNFFDNFFKGNPDLLQNLTQALEQLKDSLQQWTQGLTSELPNLFNTVASSVAGAVKLITDSVIGLVVSFYVLYNKEKFISQFKKVLFALFPAAFAKKTVSVAGEAHVVFGGFLTGTLIDSLLIGLITFVGMAIMQMPYAVLISVLVGVTNIIPFFGPFIGAIPASFLLLMESPQKMIWFVLFVIALQQVDGNILKPKILGGTTGLSSFWILFAILIGGGIFGFIGMIFGVPVFSILYTLIARWANRRLIKKNLPTDTAAYFHTNTLPDQTNDE